MDGQHRLSQSGADAAHRLDGLEHQALVGVGEAVEGQRVLAYDEAGREPRLLADAQGRERARRTHDADTDPADLDHFFQSNPPAGILTGFEHHEFELPLVTYARKHGYSPHPLQERGNLWLAKK